MQQRTNAALISVQEIVANYLLQRGKTIHELWKILPMACTAVQELVMTTIPAVHHIELTRVEGQNYFKLPPAFTDWVSVGIRHGARWVPVVVSKKLMPILNTECSGKEYSDQYSGGFRRQGDYKSWLNHECKYGSADFFDGDFLNSDFSDTDTTLTTQTSSANDPIKSFFPFYDYATNSNGEYTAGIFTNNSRPDEVVFNVQKKIIICPDEFPSDKLYLVYVGVGAADTMTYIPVTAQACIEAYIDWKYAHVRARRDGAGMANYFKTEFDSQHRILRGRLSTLTTSVIRRIIDKGYNIVGNNSGVHAGNSRNGGATTVIYQKDNGITITVQSAGTTVTDSRLLGKRILSLLINSVPKNTGYNLSGTTISFTDGTTFIGGEIIAVNYE